MSVDVSRLPSPVVEGPGARPAASGAGRLLVSALCLAVVAIALSTLTAAALIGAAALTGSPARALVVAVGTVTLTSALASWSLARPVRTLRGRWGRALRRGSIRWAVLFSSTLLLSCSWAVPAPAVSPADPAIATRWLARPDGTSLAVHLTRAATATQPPLIILHGGPGVADMAHDAPAFAALATDRDVYVYDRIGTGASSRLTDPSGYTITRAVADLEAIRADIGAPRIALHAHSWGARIAVAYAQDHPDRVAALVLSAPGDLPLDGRAAVPGDLTTRLTPAQRARLDLQLARPRNLFTYALTVADPKVAHRFARDAEMDRRFAAIYAASTPALFCDQRLADRVGTQGLGFYAHYVPQLHPDPADEPIAVDRLAQLTAPVLVIKPACDYLPWSTTTGYRQALPQARLVMLPDAGHVAYLERPGLYIDLVHAFLVGAPLPLPTLNGSTVPGDYRGTR